MLSFYLERFDNEEDKKIFTELYNSHQQLMYKVAFRQLHNEAMAEDAVHEAFIQLSENFEKFLEVNEKSRTAYVCKITYRCAVRMFHSEIENADIPFDDDFENVSEPSAEEIVWENYNSESLQNAILGLPDKYRIPMMLRFAEGLEYAEISRSLNLSESTARQRISRGKQKLKEILDREARENG